MASLYREALNHLHEVGLPAEVPGTTHVYHQFTIRLKRRDILQRALRESGIESVAYYPVPLHLQTMYSQLGYREGDLPVCERAAAEVLSLPMFPEMTENDVGYVAESIEKCLRARVD